MDAVVDGLTRPTLILFDEIARAVSAPEFDLAFWGSLRALSSTLTDGLLGYVVTADRIPFEVARDGLKPPPFFNICGHTLRLGPFTAAEARDFIACAPIQVTEEEADWIIEKSGGWPLLLQSLCHACWLARAEGERGDGWRRQALLDLTPFQALLKP